ncbi:hypothetical protein [Nonomuraea dietziae]|uniref:Uncharacterized protein n=1 Tax=Nonomuraea dietziae TaxID=65515 RepID=A0A7W5YAU0_9ACTN|nr:hypothetical protein [Nonomuraea dietziae]MBB3727433.1 hypothetical protein [Nonomuraea dietziae]
MQRRRDPGTHGDDDDIPHGIVRDEWTAMAAEDRLVLLFGGDREESPEERVEGA